MGTPSIGCTCWIIPVSYTHLNDGLIPTCVKVEAETVYYNMTKLLDKIKELAK